jgi:hypothetical protein
MSDQPLDRAELFDPGFLDRLRMLALRLRKRRQLLRRGSQSTPATGFTREFKDYRHYTPREDYRAIDWRLYARLDKLFVRLYEETQELNLHILVDTSTSMAAALSRKAPPGTPLRRRARLPRPQQSAARQPLLPQRYRPPRAAAPARSGQH